MNNSAENLLEQSASLYHSNIIEGWEKLYVKKRKLMAEMFRKHFQGNSALELGVADGEMTQHLIPYFSDYTIVDGSKKHLEETSQRLYNLGIIGVQSIHSLFEEYEPERNFDVIIVAHILEHLEDPINLLTRAKEWLSKKGLMFILVPNANSIHRHIGVKLGMLERADSLNKQDKILGHLRVYYPEQLREHVLSAGLEIVRFGGLMIKPLSNRQIESQWSDELIDAFFALSDDFPEICSEIYIIAKAK